MDLGRALPCLSEPCTGHQVWDRYWWWRSDSFQPWGRPRGCSLKPREVVCAPPQRERNFGNPGSLTGDSPLPRPGSWRLRRRPATLGFWADRPAPPGPHVSDVPRVPLPVILGRAMINPSAASSVRHWSLGPTGARDRARCRPVPSPSAPSSPQPAAMDFLLRPQVRGAVCPPPPTLG